MQAKKQVQKFIVVFMFILMLFPVSTLYAETNVNAVQEKILAVTPEWVSKPIITTIERLEEFREKNIVLAKEKKLEFNQEVESSNNKYFAYAKLFLMTFLTLIFEQKVLFYGLLLIFLATIFRFIWRKIF